MRDHINLKWEIFSNPRPIYQKTITTNIDKHPSKKSRDPWISYQLALIDFSHN